MERSGPAGALFTRTLIAHELLCRALQLELDDLLFGIDKHACAGRLAFRGGELPEGRPPGLVLDSVIARLNGGFFAEPLANDLFARLC